MNLGKIIKLAAYAVAGLGLLTGSFVIVAARSGAELSGLPVIGRLFPAPKEATQAAVDTTLTIAQEVEQDQRGPRQVVDSSQNVLGAFHYPSPWTFERLNELELALKARVHEVDERDRKLASRAEQLDQREAFLNDLESQLEGLMNKLRDEKDEVDARQSEVTAAETEAEARREEGRRKVAELYAEADKPAETAKMLLATYNATEAGKILAYMDADQARTIMTAMYKDPELVKEHPDVLAAWVEANSKTK